MGGGRRSAADHAVARAGGVLLVGVTCAATLALVASDLVAGRSLEIVALAVAILTFPATAAVILRRHPTHAIGWCLLVLGALLATGQLSSRVLPPAPSQLVVLAAWYGEWYWIPMLLLAFVTVPMLFPTGRPPSPRWRPVLWGLGAVGTVAVLGAWTQQELAVGVDVLGSVRTSVDNPIGVAPWQDVEVAWPGSLLFAVLFPTIVLAVVSLGVRARRAGTVERQQLKWGALGAGGLCVGFLLVIAVESLLGVRPPTWSEFALLGIVPVSFAIAISRTRLYDIDRIISRSLAYLIVTLLLGAVYAASVVASQAVLRPVTGSSDLAVAASTLVVAGSFGPVRRRVQALVDHRFNRRGLEGQHVLERFAHRLRSQVSLPAVVDDLRDTAHLAMQPSQSSVWLAPQDVRPRP